MAGAVKYCVKPDSGRLFPFSRYNDPRGGGSSALERNILRYRAIEITLYLFYNEEIRNFMLTDVYPVAICENFYAISEVPDKKRLSCLLDRLLRDAEAANKLSIEDADTLRQTFLGAGQEGKKLKIAFAFAVKIGIFSEEEASELQMLLGYRNDIAHRIHLVMSDISRNYEAINYTNYFRPKYKYEALGKLRVFRNIIPTRIAKKLRRTLGLNSALFEMAEHVFELDLRRLDRLIAKQIVRERERYKKISGEFNLQGTELVEDLSPRFPANHRSSRTSCGDNYMPATGHLTKRGVEICYRLFDMGKTPLAVAYLMGMSLRSAKRRQQNWIKSGGFSRIRAEVKRYDMYTMQKSGTEMISMKKTGEGV
ncbi:hypothetical protein GOB93_16410 [Acetobacter musti]|uniref:Apea-like HEPN domain-containing protein n=1 Tax=Acetobacter musti TaxID=864732 RepID=A0ABX0JUL6_9PROT|nr:hypothetical protein [Acetobacter musti]NHN86211.1 hypothetical protein [Acetobacter musti]